MDELVQSATSIRLFLYALDFRLQPLAHQLVIA